MKGINKKLKKPTSVQQSIDTIIPIVKQCVYDIKKNYPYVEMSILINSRKEEAKELPYLIEINIDSLRQ